MTWSEEKAARALPERVRWVHDKECGCDRTHCLVLARTQDTYDAGYDAGLAEGRALERRDVVAYGAERVASLNKSGNPYRAYEPDIQGAKADAVESFVDDITSAAHVPGDTKEGAK